MKHLLLLLFVSAVIVGCGGGQVAGKKLTVLGEQRMHKEAGEVTFQGVPLSSGQIVLTEEGTPFSQFLTLAQRDFLPYTHAGILVVEKGVPYVYDMRGGLRPNWSGGPPTDVMHGGIARRSLKEIVRKNRIVAIYNPPQQAHRGKMVTFVWKSVVRKVDFDPYFDYSDHSRLYCVEFVAVALQQAGAALPELQPLRDNPSLAVAFRWLKFQDSRIMAAGSFAVPERHVATFSATFTPDEIAAYFVIKQELHQRFAADQKIGSLFQWKQNKLQFRPEVKEFRRQALALAGRSGQVAEPEQIETMVQKLADGFFAEPNPVFAAVQAISTSK